MTGGTGSSDFPTTAGAFDTTHNGGDDAFVTKLDASGAALGYSTYLGGSGGEDGYGLALDGAGSAYLTGGTGSSDFPTTAGAFDTTLNGATDAFVTKLDLAARRHHLHRHRHRLRHHLHRHRRLHRHLRRHRLHLRRHRHRHRHRLRHRLRRHLRLRRHPRPHRRPLSSGAWCRG